MPFIRVIALFARTLEEMSGARALATRPGRPTPTTTPHDRAFIKASSGLSYQNKAKRRRLVRQATIRDAVIGTCARRLRRAVKVASRKIVHFVYIVRCADGTLYTGYARDPVERLKVHNSGRGAHYTACRLPVSLVYAESFDSKSDALRRELDLKRWTRAKKEALVCAPHGAGQRRGPKVRPGKAQ